MTLIAHQAIFGEKNNAHRLICASISDQKLLLKLRNKTDLPATILPRNLQWKPYVSGFPLERYYVVSKTFLDEYAPRSGMVLTHVILLDLHEVGQLDNLQPVFQLLPHGPVKKTAISSTEIVISQATRPSEPPAGLAKLVKLLLQDNDKKPVVWVGQEGFIEAIQYLWQNLWSAARCALKFRLSFGPQDIQGEQWTLLSTPKALESKWSRYALVRKSDIYIPQTKAEAFLLGLPTSEPLRALFQQLNVSQENLDIIFDLETCWGYFQSIAQNDTITIGKVRTVVRAFGALSPKLEHGVVPKSKALSRLCELTKNSTSRDIKALRNLNVTPFVDGPEFIREAILGWGETRFIRESLDKPEQTADLIVLSFESNFPEWSSIIQEILIETLSAWETNTSSLVWGWWRAKDKLVSLLSPYIPNESRVEKELSHECPTQLSSGFGEKVQELARGRQWLVLHAVVVAACHPPLVAIRKQLEIDQAGTHYDGLQELAKRVPDEVLVQAALDKGEARLLRLAGGVCAKNPRLLANLDVHRKEWRKIWLMAIQADLSPWNNIPQPQTVMYSMMDLLIKGENINSELLIRLAQAPYGDLAEYAKRRQVWSRMPRKAELQYLHITADGWLGRFREGKDTEGVVEEPLKRAILDLSRLKNIFNRDIRGGIRLFIRFPKLRSSDFENLLEVWLTHHRYIPQADSREIGRMVAKREWANTASVLYRGVRYRGRTDLKPALNECDHLLNPLDKFMRWWFGGGTTGQINQYDWWKAFAEVATHLYPEGPRDQEIWARADGDIAVINKSLPGKTSWEVALRKLRWGGGGGQSLSISRLLDEMSADFPNNNQLIQLRKWLEEGAESTSTFGSENAIVNRTSQEEGKANISVGQVTGHEVVIGTKIVYR